jgi:hypothetical protein
LYRRGKCWCPKCEREHVDLIAWDQRRGTGPVKQICETCYTEGFSPEQRESYHRWRRSVMPPPEAEEEPPRPATQEALLFGGDGDGDDRPSRPKAPPGPWERYVEATRGRR